MLKTHQKALILEQAGIAIPVYPGESGNAPGDGIATAVHWKDDARGLADAIHAWNRNIESLYAVYSANRAAKSLRESEAARILGNLQAGRHPHHRS